MSIFRNEDAEALVAAFKALGHPHRLEIFRRLATCCAPGTVCAGDAAVRRCVGDIAAGLDIAPSTVSHHLREMAHAGLIATERHGREIHCRVDPETLGALRDFLSELCEQ